MRATVIKGDDKDLIFTVKDKETDTAVNITGATITFQLKKKPTDASAVLEKTVGSGIVLTTPASGIFTVTLTDVDTDALDVTSYFMEAQITDTGSLKSSLRDINDGLGVLTVKQDLV